MKPLHLCSQNPNRDLVHRTITNSWEIIMYYEYFKIITNIQNSFQQNCCPVQTSDQHHCHIHSYVCTPVNCSCMLHVRRGNSYEYSLWHLPLSYATCSCKSGVTALFYPSWNLSRNQAVKGIPIFIKCCCPRKFIGSNMRKLIILKMLISFTPVWISLTSVTH